jgi:hypothetical protein
MTRAERRKLIFVPPRKAERNPNPIKQNSAQLSTKLDKLVKALKKLRKKSKKRHYEDSNSNYE